MTKLKIAIAIVAGFVALSAWAVCAVGRELDEFQPFYGEAGDIEW